MAQVFSEVLESAVLYQHDNDSVRWLPDVQVSYSVRSGMVLLESRQSGFPIIDSGLEALKAVWSASVPFSIKVFGWRTILNRFLSRDSFFVGEFLYIFRTVAATFVMRFRNLSSTL